MKRREFVTGAVALGTLSVLTGASAESCRHRYAFQGRLELFAEQGHPTRVVEMGHADPARLGRVLRFRRTPGLAEPTFVRQCLDCRHQEAAVVGIDQWAACRDCVHCREPSPEDLLPISEYLEGALWGHFGPHGLPHVVVVRGHKFREGRLETTITFRDHDPALRTRHLVVVSPHPAGFAVQADAAHHEFLVPAGSVPHIALMLLRARAV